MMGRCFPNPSGVGLARCHWSTASARCGVVGRTLERPGGHYLNVHHHVLASLHYQNVGNSTCGWQSTWAVALCAVTRCPPPRFCTGARDSDVVRPSLAGCTAADLEKCDKCLEHLSLTSTIQHHACSTNKRSARCCGHSGMACAVPVEVHNTRAAVMCVHVYTAGAASLHKHSDETAMQSAPYFGTHRTSPAMLYAL